MELAGASNEGVSFTATQTLEEITTACGYAGVADLIRSAAPHFWYPLSMKLRRLNDFPSAPLVLQVALRYAGPQLVSYTQELVEEAIAALDLHHVESYTPMLRVLLAYVSAVRLWEEGEVDNASITTTTTATAATTTTITVKEDVKLTTSSTTTAQEEEEEVRKMKEEGEDVRKEEEEVKEGMKGSHRGAIAIFLQDYHETKLCVRRGLEEEEEEEIKNLKEEKKEEEEEEGSKNLTDPTNTAPPPSPPPTPPPPPPPRSLELVVEVVERCSHLLHRGGREGRLLTLEVARTGCHALKHWEDLLLPSLHKLWRPLILCLSNCDVVVAIRTLNLIVEVVSLSGDFLRRRVVTEALPIVLKYLECQTSATGSKECLTQGGKAMCKFLKALSLIVPRLDLSVRDGGRVVNVVSLYLDLRHSREVYEAALCLLKVMGRSHPHHVWLCLAFQRPLTCLVHPSPCRLLPQVKVR